MIVPDKKTEAYLNKPARMESIVRLCRAGVLLPTDFLKAAFLCRSDKGWLEKSRKGLSRLAGLGFCMAVVLLAVSGWHFLYTIQGYVFLTLAFLACACMRKFAIVEYVGAFLIGAMVFLPDMVFGTNTFLYEQFFLWFFLAFLWALPSRRTGILLTPLIILNAAIALYGVQFVLPSSRMGCVSFCALLAAMNIGALAVREKNDFRLFSAPAFRFVPVALSCLFLLAGAGGRFFSQDSIWAFICCLVFTLGAGGFYLFERFDRQICRLLICFCALWGSLLLYQGINLLPFSEPTGQSLFFCSESLLVIATAVLMHQFNVLLKGEKNGV